MDTITPSLLQEIIKRHGEVILEEPKRLEAILLDRCPGKRRDISLIMAVLKEGIAEYVREFGKPAMSAADVQLLSKRYFDQTGLDEGMLVEAIVIWVETLGLTAARPVQVQQGASPGVPTIAHTQAGHQVSKQAAASNAAPSPAAGYPMTSSSPPKSFIQKHGIWLGLAGGALIAVLLFYAFRSNPDPDRATVSAMTPTPASTTPEPSVLQVAATEEPVTTEPEARYRFQMTGQDGILYQVKLYSANESNHIEESGSAAASVGDEIYSGNYILEIEGDDGSRDRIALPDMTFNAARDMVRPVPGHGDLLQVHQFGDSSNDEITLYRISEGKVNVLSFNESGDIYQDIIGNGLNAGGGNRFQSAIYDNDSGSWRFTNWEMDSSNRIMTATGSTVIEGSSPVEAKRFSKDPSYLVPILTGKPVSMAKMNTFMSNYLDAAMLAVKNYDFDYMSSYLNPGGTAYTEQKDYLNYLKSKKIKEKLNTAEVTSIVNAADGIYHVTTYEEYTITYADKSSKLKSFRSQFKVISDGAGSFMIDSLIDTEELSSVNL